MQLSHRINLPVNELCSLVNSPSFLPKQGHRCQTQHLLWTCLWAAHIHYMHVYINKIGGSLNNILRHPIGRPW